MSSNTISVLDTTANQNTLVATVGLSYPPKYLAINSSGTRVGVTMSANNNQNSVAIIDTGSKTVLGSLSISNPLGIAVSLDGSRAYVVTGSGSVKVVSTANYSVTGTLSVSSGSELIAITADEKRAYVPGADDKAVSVIDLAAGNVIGTVSVGKGAKGVAITTPSWNPAVSCVPVVVTLRQILGTQQNANGGALRQGGYPYTIPDKTALAPPCTVNGGPTFVQVNNLLVKSGTLATYSDGDYAFDLIDDNDPNSNIYMKTIHPEDNGEWQEAGIDPALTITPGLPSTLVPGQRIDIQGFVYWDPGHVTEAWHSYSGWEIHPLAAWRINPSSPPVSSLPPISVILGFNKAGVVTAIQSNLITFQSDDNLTYYIKVPAGTPLYDSQGGPSIKLTDMRVNDRITVAGKFGYETVELGTIKDLALSSYLFGTITSISASQVSVRSTTLVATGATYTATITPSALFYDNNGVPIAPSAMKTGDSVYVSGLIRGLTVTLVSIKDFYYPPVPPTADSVSPSSGSASSQVFTLRFSDANGFTNLNIGYVLFNSILNGANACFAAYSRVDNVFYLINDAGNGLVPGSLAPGSAGTLSNSMCTLNGSGSTVNGSGNTQTVLVSLTFKSAFIGSKNIYMLAADLQGLDSGWQLKGTWTGNTDRAPTVGTASPVNGAGASQAFTIGYADADGFQDIALTYVLFNAGLSGVNGCMLAYNQGANLLYLINDAGTGTLSPQLRGPTNLSAPVPPGGAGSVSNSQCTLNGTGSSISPSGNNLSVTVNLTFLPAFTGVKNIYGLAVDNSGANSGWQTLGTWSRAANQAPTVVSATPNSGSGASQVFTFVYSDPDGYTDLSLAYALFNSAVNGANACYVAYSLPANLLYLVNDAGNGLVAGTVTPGAAGSITNSQCALASGGAVTGSGTNLTVPVSLTFTPAFTGPKNIYMLAVDSSGTFNNGSLTLKGTWTVP